MPKSNIKCSKQISLIFLLFLALVNSNPTYKLQKQPPYYINLSIIIKTYFCGVHTQKYSYFIVKNGIYVYVNSSVSINFLSYVTSTKVPLSLG